MTKKGMAQAALGLVGVLALVMGGCSASEEIGRSSTPSAGEPSASAPEVPSAAVTPPASAPERGELVRSVGASEDTRRDQGIVLWAIYKRGAVFTSYGLDRNGAVKAELGVARNPANGDLRMHAPSTGVLHVRADGSVVSNTFEISKAPGVGALQHDIAAESKERPYGICFPDSWFADALDDLLRCRDAWYGGIACDPIPRNPCDPPPPPVCSVVCYQGRVDPLTCSCVDDTPPWWAF